MALQGAEQSCSCFPVILAESVLCKTCVLSAACGPFKPSLTQRHNGSIELIHKQPRKGHSGAQIRAYILEKPRAMPAQVQALFFCFFL